MALSSTSTRPAESAGTIDLGGDVTVNRLGCGAMRITGDGLWGPPADRNVAIRVLRRAVESLGALVELRDEGKVRQLGLSNVDEDQLDEALTVTPVVSVQNRSTSVTGTQRRWSTAASWTEWPSSPGSRSGPAPSTTAEVR